MTTTSATDRSPQPVGYRHRWTVLALVIVADVMDLVDATIANLAGPSIRADLGGGESTLQWLLAAYTLTFAVALVTSARLGDLVGRRRMFLIGMIGFTAASLACGFAPSPEWLIAARVAQGLFGASMIPQGLAMVKAVFPPEDLQKAFIPFGPAMGLSVVVGPILAGYLIDTDLFGWGWRSIFWINVPVGVIAAVLAWRFLPDDPAVTHSRGIDLPGAGLLTVASTLLILPLVQGREHGWPAWAFVMLGASGVSFSLFALRERRTAHPVIEPSLLTHRGFVAGLAFMCAFFAAMVGANLTLNLFLQLGQHRTPFDTGLAMTPLALGMAVAAAASGAVLGPRFGRRVIHVGVALAALAQIALWWTLNHGGAGTSVWSLAPGLFVLGLGAGSVFAPLFDIILTTLTDAEVGSGSGVLSAVQQFAGALGVSALGTLFFDRIAEAGVLEATQSVLIASSVLYAAAFVAAYALPRFAREGLSPT